MTYPYTFTPNYAISKHVLDGLVLKKDVICPCMYVTMVLKSCVWEEHIKTLMFSSSILHDLNVENIIESCPVSPNLKGHILHHLKNCCGKSK